MSSFWNFLTGKRNKKNDVYDVGNNYLTKLIKEYNKKQEKFGEDFNHDEKEKILDKIKKEIPDQIFVTCFLVPKNITKKELKTYIGDPMLYNVNGKFYVPVFTQQIKMYQFINKVKSAKKGYVYSDCNRTLYAEWIYEKIFVAKKLIADNADVKKDKTTQENDKKIETNDNIIEYKNKCVYKNVLSKLISLEIPDKDISYMMKFYLYDGICINPNNDKESLIISFDTLNEIYTKIDKEREKNNIANTDYITGKNVNEI